MRFSLPALELRDVTGVLELHGFELANSVGSIQTWVGSIEGDHRIVQLDVTDAPFSYWSQVLRAAIRNSGIPRRIFYWEAKKPLPWGVL